MVGSSIVNPGATIELLSSHWSRSPFHARGAVSGPLRELSAERVFATYLERAADAVGFTSYHAGNAARTDGRAAVLSVIERSGGGSTAALEAFSRSAALVVQGAQRYFGEVDDLLRTWPPISAASVNANVYLTRQESSVFAVHHDEHHVIAIQTEGVKEWRVWPPVVAAPHRRFAFDPETPADEPMRFTTEPGDALYLPLGWLHDARTLGGCSVHVTVGVTPPRWLDVIEATVLKMAAESSLLRSELPSAMDGGERVYFAEDARHVRAILDYLHEHLLATLPAAIAGQKREVR